MRPDRNVLSLLLTVVASAACSGGASDGAGKSVQATEATPPATTTTPAPPEPAVEEPALLNLTAQCSDDTEESFVKNEAVTEAGLVACIVRDAAGKLVDAKDVRVTAETTAGALEVSAVAKTNTSSPWQVGFAADQTTVASLARIELSFAVAGKPLKAATTATDFDWRGDPLFTEFLRFYTGLINALVDPVGYDAKKHIAELRKDPKLAVMFASDDLFRGDLTVAVGDAYCANAGAKVDPTFSWRAFLATPTQSVRERFPLTSYVLDFEGSFVNDDGDFWTVNWQTSHKFPTQTGIDPTTKLVQIDGTERLVTEVWTGTTATGDRSAADCSAWTSAATDENGLMSTPYSKGRREILRACSTVGRILCVGEQP